MGITGLIPFIEKASRRANVNEFNGCTVAIDSYCWLHKGAFACADKLVRGEDTDIYIKYCIKYVTMLLSKNIKPILVFDGRHLPAKAITESKRRESRDISKKRAAEFLSLGKIEEARSYMKRSVDITHAMALGLIKECRKRNVDCIVAPYEADAQLAYLNMKNIAQLVITEDSDLVLFGCTKVLFKMDLEGTGTLVETAKLPLVMKCPIEYYSFDKFRQMCIMSGCDYLASLPGIGLAKARQFVTATQDSNFANALKKLPSFFNKSSLVVTDEYRESFLKAEATFKHQYVYDPIRRQMVRLTEPDDEDIEQALCVNAGELLEPKIAFQLALGNLDPFTLKKMDDWHPDYCNNKNEPVKTGSWKDKGVSSHPSIWAPKFKSYLDEPQPWQKKVEKVEPIITAPTTRPRKKIVNLVSKYVPESQTQDESLSIETLSNMYCLEPASKKTKIDHEIDSEKLIQVKDLGLKHNDISNRKTKSPILENKERSYRKCLKNGGLRKLSRFPRTVLDDNVVESKFFSNNEDTAISNDISKESITIEESPEKINRNPFHLVKSPASDNFNVSDQTECSEEVLDNSQKENSPFNSPIKKVSPILEPNERSKNPFRLKLNFDSAMSEDSVIENTYPMENLVTPTDMAESFGASFIEHSNIWMNSQPHITNSQPQITNSQPKVGSCLNGFKKSVSKVPLKKSLSLPSNQPTLLSKFGFQKKPIMKR